MDKNIQTKNKVTKGIPYVSGCAPDFVFPNTYQNHRYALGKKGNNPIICIGMNPSAAREEYSDMTVNKVIRNTKNIYDGWIMLNVYPERATDAKMLDAYNDKLHRGNIKHIISIIKKYNVTEVWGAWGDIDTKKDYLTEVKNDIINALRKNNIKIFYFGDLTKLGNPRHPLYIKIDFNNKNYLK